MDMTIHRRPRADIKGVALVPSGFSSWLKNSRLRSSWWWRQYFTFPLVLQHSWLSNRKAIQPVRIRLSLPSKVLLTS